MVLLSEVLRHTNVRHGRPRPTTPARALLSEADFTYLGKYTTPTEWLTGQGMTARTVAGEFRLMAFRHDNTWTPSTLRLYEFTRPGSFDQPLVAKATHWDNFWDGTTSPGQHVNLTWDEGLQKLWAGTSIDYPALELNEGNWTSALSTRTLNTDGTVSNFGGYWGLQGVGQRAHYGGVAFVPQWFQTANGVGPYVSGFGGYTSLMAAQLRPSLGLTLFFIPDPHGVYTPQVYDTTAYNIPSTDFKVGADHRGGVTESDWQGVGYAARTKDRGPRVNTDCVNHFDSPPGTLAATPVNWLTPMPGDPDGWGRQTWGDRYSNAIWFDDDAGGRARHGLLVALSCGSGDCYYASSDLHYAGRVFELHVYDPADIALVVAGTLAPYKIRPAHMWEITLPGMGTSGPYTGSSEARNISGLAYDPVTSRLYVRGQAAVYVYSVNTGA